MGFISVSGHAITITRILQLTKLKYQEVRNINHIYSVLLILFKKIVLNEALL